MPMSSVCIVHIKKNTCVIMYGVIKFIEFSIYRMPYPMIVLRSLGEHGGHGGQVWGVDRITAWHYWAVGQSPGASPCLGLLSFLQKSLPGLPYLMTL